MINTPPRQRRRATTVALACITSFLPVFVVGKQQHGKVSTQSSIYFSRRVIFLIETWVIPGT